MVVKTFDWSPLNGPTGDITRTVTEVEFGDGYEQVMDNDMNSERQSWPLTFIDTWSQIQPIIAFLREHGEARAFKWVNPLGELGLYRAKQLKPQAMGFGKWTVTVTFVTFYRS
ncbi:phage tail protein [Pectobacterium aroidearum]|uniref:Phage tail protein n=1 Tax=Pectobacterium aroidearum TaxID=1201031 RepID=A0ABR5ZJJ2_9GAMM|nr:phage tail protein [Pectobacterium aroidearum]MBA5234750.1 phage tail protein [Pectobacterium aroidearum]MBA5739929.1 phage tail protein [Pectobacterium aroidearum]